MSSVTLPFPLPTGLPEIWIHGAWLSAVHPQPLRAPTLNLVVPPVASTVDDAGSRAYVHGAAALPWLIWMVCPAATNVDVRGSPGFASMWNATLPGPFGFCVPVIEIHGAPLAAVHRQPSSVSTVTVPSPPVASNVSDGGLTENWHGAAACVSSTRASPTTTLPRRTAGAGLLVAEYWMVPSPWPDCPAVIVSHGTSLDAVHVHSRAAEMLTVPVPPSAATDEPPARETAQRVEEGLTIVVVDEPHPAATTSAAPTIHERTAALRSRVLGRSFLATAPFTVAAHAGARPIAMG
jgi:hypothetical protein